MAGRRQNKKDQDPNKPTIDIIGIAGGNIKKGCVIGGRNITVKGRVDNPIRVVGVESGDHGHVNIIGLDRATLGGDSGDDDDIDGKSYFGGKDTGVLMIAGKTRPKDGNVFLNDLEDLTVKMKEFGIREDHIFKVTPHGRGYQERNIKRAVEDLIDMDIKKFILLYAGHCNEKKEFLLDNREQQGFWYPHQQLKACLQTLPATKMLIILDTCFSGSLDMGTRREEEKGEGGIEGGRGSGEDGKRKGKGGDEIVDSKGQKRGREMDEGERGRKRPEEELEEDMQLGSDELYSGSEQFQGQRKRVKGSSGQYISYQTDTDIGGQGTRAIGVAGCDETDDSDGVDLGDDLEMDDGDEDDLEGWVQPFELPEMPCFWDIFEGMVDVGSRGLVDHQVVQWCSSSRNQESHNHGGGRNGVFTNAILETVDAKPIGNTTSVFDIHNIVFRKIKLRQNPILKTNQAGEQSSSFHKRFPKFRKTASYIRNMQ